MSNKNYAIIKDNVVINVIVFDDPTEELIALFKTENNANKILEVDNTVSIGSTYDGVRFVPKKPFPSWELNEENYQWYAPVAYPTDNKPYTWDESTLSWIEIAI
jgi:hypothetical protein